MARIALLTGGSTPERDVALAGAYQVAPTLRELGHRVTVVDTVEGPLDRRREAELLRPGVEREPPGAETLAELARREDLPALVADPALAGSDLVFLLLHGDQGEGGAVQALLDLAGLRYTGSDALGSGLAMDKEVSKRLLAQAGLPQAPWRRWPVEGVASFAALGLPVIVKPSRAGSSVGLSVVHDAAEIPGAAAAAAAVDREVLIEGFLPGREFSVGVLGDRALAAGEIIPEHEIFDYECKYTPGMCQEIFPAEIDDALASRLGELAIATHRVLRLRDFSRIDFKLDADGEPAVLEANTLPGMTAGSLLPKSAAAAGIPFAELCSRICELALAR
ncbi:MAG TPA: D-alanine--D-alanine ligase [Thermoanaerobaculia bacterium]|nr:D-alanine--D-alanine ligase [Thermoanaerobaculia bacterium]